MSDSKNMELNDEVVATAAGGADSEIPEPRFKVGDIAVQTNGDFRVEILAVLGYHSKEWGWNYRIKIRTIACIPLPRLTSPGSFRYRYL